MQYNKLGKSGIRLSELGLGSWITFAKHLDLNEIKRFMHFAFDSGIQFFDNAESYAHGEAEILMGKAIKEFRREDLVISTKIFWGGNGPNDTGLSRKHILEGTKNSLKRLQLSYVDLLFCHRPDPETPIIETVRAMDQLIRDGLVLYWGTSMWRAEEIIEAHTIAEKINCIPPSMEQPCYNMFARELVEKDYLKLFSQYGMGLTTWSPLASGVLSNKYRDGIREDTRLAKEAWLIPAQFRDQVEKTKALARVSDQLGCTPAQLAIAWILKNPNVTSVILGATKKEQLEENMIAIDVKQQLTADVLITINKILK